MLRHSTLVKRGRLAAQGGVSAALLLASVGGSPAAAANPAMAPADSPVEQAGTPGAPAGNDWPTYGGNLFNQRFSSLNQINTTNVAQLKGACTFHTTEQGVRPDLLPASSFETSPLVVGGTMFLTGPQSQVWAIDATNCQLKWKYLPEPLRTATLPICCGLDNRGVAIGDGKVFVAQLDAKLVALDQTNGDVVWSVQVADPRAGYSETVAPLFFNGLVIVGASGAEYEIQGHVTAFDAATGQQKWRFFTTPDPFGGGSVWQTPALDPDLGLVYIGVGNPSPDVDGSNRAGDNLFTVSVVALDVATGQPRWHFQEVHHDIWDYDAVSPSVLFDTVDPASGRTIHGLGQAGKTGWVYLLDRATGAPLLPIVETPVPQNANQKTAATQPIPQGDPFSPNLNAAECSPPVTVNGVVLSPNPIFTPFDAGPVMLCPGSRGGAEWSPSSFSPQTGLMYVCGINRPVVFTRHPEQLGQAFLRLGSALAGVPGGPTFGTFTAINVHTNRIAWQHRGDKENDFKDMCVGGSLATAGGLVFVGGEANGLFKAYDAATGQRLLQSQTGAGVNAPPVTYMVNGTQFVAVASGGNSLFNYPRGDSLWIFSLKGAQGPVAPPTAATPTTGQDKVDIRDFAFQPQVVTVPVGTTVRWSNGDDSAHTATADANQEAAPGQPVYAFDSGLLPKGADFSFTFARAGTFPYHCNLHLNMVGRVVVTPSTGGVTPLNEAAEAAAQADDAPGLHAAIAAVLDLDTQRDALRLPRVTVDPSGDATVQVALRDAGSDQAAIRAEAQADALTILRAVYQSTDVQRVMSTTVVGTYPVESSKTGKIREGPVMRAVLSAGRAGQLDWAQVTSEQLPQLLDVWWMHPALGGSGQARVATQAPTTSDEEREVRTPPELRAQVDLMLAHLNEALFALSSSDERVVRSQFAQFFDKWDDAEGQISQQYPEQYASLDAELERTEVALLHRSPADLDTANLALRAVRQSLADIAHDLESQTRDNDGP